MGMGTQLGSSDRLRARNDLHREYRRDWVGENTSFEVHLQDLKGRRRRIDILIDDPRSDFVSVIEVKNSDWDAMAEHRIRPNALRHASQLWTYMEPFIDLKNRNVCLGIVYPHAPRTPGRKERVEEILNEKFVMVSWEDTDGKTRK
jgi:hypothetical protein